MQHYSNDDLAAVADLLSHWQLTPAGTEGYRTSYEVKELHDRMKSIFCLTNELKGDLQSVSGRQLSNVTVEKLNAKLIQIEDLVANFRT